MSLPSYGLDRPFNAGSTFVPENLRYDAVREAILWKPRLDTRSFRAGAERGVLDNFVALVDSPPEAYLRFARKWGILDLCEHDLPALHTGGRCGNLIDGDWRVEYWWAWQRTAQAFRSALNLAAQLADGKRGAKKDWNAVTATGNFGEDVASPRNMRESHENLAAVVNIWLSWGGVRPYLSYAGGRWSISFGGGRGAGWLYGLLSSQLMLAVSRTDGLAQCSACGVPYLPNRKPNPYRRSYCFDCRKRKPQRDASRAYRERLRSS